MWATLQVLQQTIRTIAESDTEQTQIINELRKEVIDMRVEFGVQRGRVADIARRVGAL
jgi:hypothetical protein